MIDNCIAAIYEFFTELFKTDIIKVVGIIFILHLIRHHFYSHVNSEYFNQTIGTIFGSPITNKIYLKLLLYISSYYFYENMLK